MVLNAKEVRRYWIANRVVNGKTRIAKTVKAVLRLSYNEHVYNMCGRREKQEVIGTKDQIIPRKVRTMEEGKS